MAQDLLERCSRRRPEPGIPSPSGRGGFNSHDRDTDQRDRIDKPIGYAEAEIPVYLLIDRDNHTLTVFSEPKDGRYQQISPSPWGATVELPTPVNITLDTEKLKDYAD
ncbi:Uma2 family endonuclease [Streptomyces violaceus]|uniref:Uma2 family endonuclease n=1 Tax=Streptomyces violaceus TaxID=1936 RepID=A0ABZ1NU73_STRVL